MGVDNAWSPAVAADRALLAADDGTTSMIGLNLSNSVELPTLLAAAEVRRSLGFDDVVRLEHHVTETWKSIVRQPYDRRADVVAAAATVPNISAKHEGGDPEIRGDAASTPATSSTTSSPRSRWSATASCRSRAQLHRQARRRGPHGRGAHEGRDRRGLRAQTAHGASGT